MDPIGSTGLNRTTFSGLATGLDTSLLIESILGFERRPLNALEARRDALSSQQSLFRDFNSKLLALRDAARAVDNHTSTLGADAFEEEFLSFTASSTDEDVVEASAGGSASAGSYTVRVDQLATVTREITESFSLKTSVIASEGETLTIDFGASDERNFTITVGAGGASLENIRDAINLDDDNDDAVQAEILFDGSSYRLIVSGTETGADNDFSLSGTGATLGDAGFVDSALSADAVDASLDVLGVTVTSASNTVEEALPGVILELTGVSDPDVATDAETVTVEIDQEGIEEKLQALVDAFNGVNDFLNEQFRYDAETKKAGLLSNDALLRSLQRQVRDVVSSIYISSDNQLDPYATLSSIGIEFGSDGSLSLDSDELEEALTTNASAVRDLLSGTDDGDGAATAIARALDPILQYGDGTLATRDDSFQRQIESLNDQIERFERRLQGREETLLLRFSRLEAAVSSLNAQSSFLASIR